MRFYCTSTGPIGGLDCEVLLYIHTHIENYTMPDGVVQLGQKFRHTHCHILTAGTLI